MRRTYIQVLWLLPVVQIKQRQGLQNMQDSNMGLCCINKFFSQSSKGKGMGFPSVKSRVQTERVIPLQNHPQGKRALLPESPGLSAQNNNKVSNLQDKQASFTSCGSFNNPAKTEDDSPP